MLQYPVKEILLEVGASSSISTNTFVQYLCLLWQQTKALFSATHLMNMTMLSGVCFLIYTGGLGLFLW